MKLAALLILLAGVATGAARAGNVDCRTCHEGAAAVAPLAEFARYYTETERHHPRAIAYPGPRDSQFHQPQRQNAEVAWFDRDGNGTPDPGEVQLFGAERTVECATCHREHGSAGSAPGTGPYLRVDQRDSALCRECHQK